MGNKNKAVEAATETGEQDRLTAAQATSADRPSQINPLGSLTWGKDANGKWVQTQNLSEDMQGLYDSDMGNIGTMNAMRENALSSAQLDMSTPPDWAQFGEAQGLEFDPSETRQRAEDASYQRATSRLDPRFSQEAQAMEVKLRNRGLREGDEAFDNAMRNFNLGKNDAYEQARLGSIGEGRSESSQMFDQQTRSTDMANALRDKKIQEHLNKRKFNLNEANSLDTSPQVAALQSSYGGG
jgi:hypothetical protein